ncbi:hypothetical protein HMPREF9471_01219, partial [[Clostridium] clostridioforme WAL-7855]
KRFWTKLTLVVRSTNFFRFFFESSQPAWLTVPTFLAYSAFSLRSSASLSLRFSSRLSSNTEEALLRNSFFQLRSRFGWMLFSVAREFKSFSPLSSSITRSDLNLALKFLLYLDIMMNPHFHTDFSISDSLIFVRKSVLIYETIIAFPWAYPAPSSTRRALRIPSSLWQSTRMRARPFSILRTTVWPAI